MHMEIAFNKRPRYPTLCIRSLRHSIQHARNHHDPASHRCSSMERNNNLDEARKIRKKAANLPNAEKQKLTYPTDFQHLNDPLRNYNRPHQNIHHPRIPPRLRRNPKRIILAPALINMASFRILHFLRPARNHNVYSKKQTMRSQHQWPLFRLPDSKLMGRGRQRRFRFASCCDPSSRNLEIANED